MKGHANDTGFANWCGSVSFLSHPLSVSLDSDMVDHRVSLCSSVSKEIVSATGPEIHTWTKGCQLTANIPVIVVNANHTSFMDSVVYLWKKVCLCSQNKRSCMLRSTKGWYSTMSSVSGIFPGGLVAQLPVSFQSGRAAKCHVQFAIATTRSNTHLHTPQSPLVHSYILHQAPAHKRQQIWRNTEKSLGPVVCSYTYSQPNFKYHVNLFDCSEVHIVVKCTNH